MAIHDIWLLNLKALVAMEGGGRKGIRTVADTTGLSEEYVYQLISEKPNKDGARREVGKRAAKIISAKFAQGRPDGWFDIPQNLGENFPPNSPNSASNQAVALANSVQAAINVVAPAQLKANEIDPLRILRMMYEETPDKFKKQALHAALLAWSPWMDASTAPTNVVQSELDAVASTSAEPREEPEVNKMPVRQETGQV